MKNNEIFGCVRPSNYVTVDIEYANLRELVKKLRKLETSASYPLRRLQQTIMAQSMAYAMRGEYKAAIERFLQLTYQLGAKEVTDKEKIAYISHCEALLRMYECR